MYHHESEEIYKLLNYDAILFDAVSYTHLTLPTKA